MPDDFPEDNICHGGRTFSHADRCTEEGTHTLLVTPDGGFVAKLCDDCLERYEQFVLQQRKTCLRAEGEGRCTS